MKIEQKIEQLGHKLPEVPEPLGVYIPALKVSDILFLTGVIPEVDGEVKYKGKLGKDLTIKEGYEAAKICALNALAVAKNYLGDLDRIERIIKVIGYINSAQGFINQPKVLNGTSEFFVKIFGEKGQHVRLAIGVAELPANACIEVEVNVQTK